MLYILAAMQKEADALLAKAEIRKEFTQFGTRRQAPCSRSRAARTGS